MTDRQPGSAAPVNPGRRVRNQASEPLTPGREYSARLAALGGFTVRHKVLVIGAWILVAVVLALLFPQLEISAESTPRATARLSPIH